jgi:very-short-patch-repair endonuclease
MDWEWIARRQGGAIQYQQLRAAGVSRDQLRRLALGGRLVRLATGIYGLPTPVDPWLQGLWSTVLVAGPDAVAWRRSAAAWWGLDGVDQRGEAEVAVGAGGRRGDPRVSRLRGRGSLEVTAERGLPLTTVAQTLCDLGTVCGLEVVERALEDALRRRLVRLSSLAARAELASAGPVGAQGGARVLCQILERRPVGAPPTESDAETLFLQLVRRAGFPEPVRQLPLVVRGRPVRVDFAWPARRLVVEIDGAATHAGDALGPDLRRQNAIVVGGWSVLRFTWEDVARYPDEVIEVLCDWWG